MSHPAIEKAISTGRILESSRAEYEQMMATRPKSTRKFLKRLAPALAGRDVEPGEADLGYPTIGLSRTEKARIAASPYDTASAAAATAVTTPPVPAPPQRSAPRASAPIPSSDEAYPREWLTERERGGAREGRITIAND